jgi:hypothetical protein
LKSPVEVTRDIPVFTGEGVHTGSPDPFISEFMGIAHNKPTTKYWFTWYANVDISTDIAIAAP